jgi:hypothetical protein
MKKLHIKLVVAFFAILTHWHCIQATNNNFRDIEYLIEWNYTYDEKTTIHTLLPIRFCFSPTAPSIASIQDILTYISSQQNAQGKIEDEETHKKSFDALQSILLSTNRSIAKIKVLKNYKQEALLIELQQTIKKKIREINPLSTFEYLTQSPALNAGVACIITTAIIAGATYYFDLLDFDLHTKATIPTTSLNSSTSKAYARINVLLDQFLDPNDKSPLSMYIAESKKLRELLLENPIENAIVIDVLETVIESENRMDYGFKTKQQLENDLFWVNILFKRTYYTSVFHQISKREIDHIDFKQLWKDKGWME